MYKCGSCGFVGEETDMGLCPNCYRDSLDVIDIKCPVCEADLGSSTKVDIKTIGWCCSKCNIKIYKER